jgi:hypothetical protein
MPKLNNAMQFTVDWFLSVTQKILEHIRDWTGWEIPDIKRSHFPKVVAFGKKVDEFLGNMR